MASGWVLGCLVKHVTTCAGVGGAAPTRRPSNVHGQTCRVKHAGVSMHGPATAFSMRTDDLAGVVDHFVAGQRCRRWCRGGRSLKANRSVNSGVDSSHCDVLVGLGADCRGQWWHWTGDQSAGSTCG